MKKRIIAILLTVVLLAGAATGGFFGYRAYSNNKLVADVTSVSYLNWGYYGDSMQSYGSVTNDESQEIYLSTSESVQEIFVEEGDSVSVGDPLLQYDMTVVNLNIEMQKLQIQAIDNKIASAKRELEKLKKTTPIQKSTTGENGTTTAVLPEDTKIVAASMMGGTENGRTTSGGAFSENSGTDAGQLPSDEPTTEQPSTEQPDTEQPTTEQPATEQPDTEQPAGDNPSQDNGSQGADGQTEQPAETPEQEPEGYTKEELAKAISDKEQELVNLDLDKRKAQLVLKQLEDQSADGMVYATVNGTIKKLGDLENPPTDGSAFLVVSGSEGLYVKGSISELVLDQVHVGQMVTGYSWESGTSFDATITEINDYPEENADAYGGNPNVSYYGYIAHIDNPDGLVNGEYAELTIQVEGDATMGGIYLEKAYVRQEDGKSYVYKEDENGRLTKQYVETGRTLYGSAIQIKSGLTEEDYIAFPYGKTAKEGVRTKRSDGGM